MDEKNECSYKLSRFKKLFIKALKRFFSNTPFTHDSAVNKNVHTLNLNRKIFLF